MAISLGGDADADINEVRFFVDRGDSFTDSNSFVWLKKGARTLDTTTYPDAFAQSAAISKTGDYQSNKTQSGNSPDGLSVSSDGAWALNYNTSYSTGYNQTDIASDTQTGNTQWPGSYSANYLVGTAYIKCNGSSPQSSIVNANDYFAIGITSYNGNSSPKVFMSTLTGGSGTDAGKPNYNQGNWTLEDTNGGDLASTYTYGTPAQPCYAHWDPVARKLYVMFAYSTSRCHLFVYTLTSSTFGHTAFSISGTQNHASSRIDWHAQIGGGSPNFYTMSGDSTHLYVLYYNSTAGGRVFRKIPLSGNLSWSSGSDIAGIVKDPASGSYLLRQSSATSFVTENIDAEPIYYKTVSSVPKFLMMGYARQLREFSINNPVIGEGTPDYRQAATQYHRIKQ